MEQPDRAPTGPATRALVTNDDGIGAPGLALLAAVAISCGLEVVVAAPGWDSSGASASFTAVNAGSGVPAVPRPIIGVTEAPAYAVEASPAFIVRAAIDGAFGPPPDIVLAGVNKGANLGHAILHSGTVGAAMTAGTLGIPALAASLASTDEAPDWSGAEAVLHHALPRFVRHPVGVLNLNIPAAAPDAIRGISSAPLATFGRVEATTSSTEGGLQRITYRPNLDGGAEGTDAHLVRSGWATVTALAPLSEALTDVSDLLHDAPVG